MAADPVLVENTKAWLYRYPGDATEPASGDVEEAYQAASEVLRAVLERLPAEVRP